MRVGVNVSKSIHRKTDIDIIRELIKTGYEPRGAAQQGATKLTDIDIASFRALGANGNESRSVLRRVGIAVARLFGADSEADGDHRLPADSLACHEILRPFRPPGFHPMPGLSRGSYQEKLSRIQQVRLQRF